jgi:alkylation response protein AidB-like acyl-CoA dehydrogenase
VLLEEAGYALAPAPLLSTTAAALMIAAAGSAAQRDAWLPGIAGGEARAAIGLGAGTLVADAADAEVIVLVDGDLGAQLLERVAATVTPVQAIDPTRRFARVHGEGEPLAGDVDRGVSQVLVAMAAEMTGICQRALDMTVEYVQDRKQFGTPVGAFQAVSHRCAEMLLATEGLRSATYAAAWAADAGDGALTEYALIAKAAGSDAVREVTASAIQLHGGIGFTWEADAHWLYKRAQLDAHQFGEAGALRARLARLLGARAAAVA